jgi:deoxyribodipyrimidine photo-lyase
LRDRWTPGEAAARARLSEFLSDDFSGYAKLRDRPDLAGTSRLSPYLAFGEVSPRQCWYAAGLAAERSEGADVALDTFQRELAWREFSAHLLYHWPRLPHEPFRPEFRQFPWQADDTLLSRWLRGLTGYPIVDAGMRELWSTGWMHNRVRMIAASFLIKDLLQPWQAGEAWFWDTLVDADLANNAASWQWVAGSGADAAPYFRIFNPVKQGETFDPEGEYVRRWVPELAGLPRKAIHAPWQAASEVLAAAGVEIGRTYPAPIVDHGKARAAALAAFAALKS